MLERYIKISLIIPDLLSDSREGVLKELASKASIEFKTLDEDVVLSALLEREDIGSTGIENGIAIPHAKLNDISDTFIVVGRSKKGINFASLDGKPTHLFFVLLAPSTSAGEHMKALARLAKVLASAGLKEKLLAAGSASEIYDALIKADKTC